MKYFIVTGEKSGDLHASNLAKEIFAVDPEAEIQAWGGEKLAKAGATILQDYRDLAFMGFIEVIRHLPKIYQLFNVIKKQIGDFQPDVIVLVDYGGFNMKVARWGHENNFKVSYYIPPKVWAWNQSRAKKIKKYLDLVMVIFPFESEFFKKYSLNAPFVGNPLFDEIAEFKPNPDFIGQNKLDSRPIIALLPGSRKQEIQNMVGVMNQLTSKYPDCQFVVAALKELDISIYSGFISDNFKLVFDDTYNLLSHAKAAIVTSGTATLETALFEVPQVVVYKTAKLTYAIAKRLIKVDYISLVNLIAQKEVVVELIQEDYNVVNLEKHLNLILQDTKFKENQLIEYQNIRKKLGSVGASKNAAQLVYNLTKSKK
jgi:lipid-A-disaccharide synthase